MKIAVVGTGVIGTLYGWALSKSNEVIHYVRTGKKAKYNNQEIALDLIDERKKEGEQNITSSYTYHCVENVDSTYDWIIVPTNSFQVVEALKQIVPQAPHSKYLIMSLNWNGLDAIEEQLPKEQFIMGYAGGGGTFIDKQEETVLWGNIGADILLGAAYEEQRPLLKEADTMFKKEGIVPEIPENIVHTLWMHNVGSAPLGAGLIKYRNMDQFLEDEALVKTCFTAMSEAYQICGKRGVDLTKYPEVAMYSMPFEQLFPMFKMNFQTNPVMKRYTAHAIKAIDEMVSNFLLMYETGKQLNVEMPAMDVIADIVKQYE